jgi:hypothetical protein
MWKREVFVHACVLAALISVGVGAFEAAGAATNPVATSNKFTGPAEPPSTWYVNSTQVGGTSEIIAAPRAGTALVVQAISVGNDFASPADLGVWVDASPDLSGAGPCVDMLPTTSNGASSSGMVDVVMAPAGNSFAKTYGPGVAIPAGDVLCARSSSGSNITVTVTGYIAAATLVPPIVTTPITAP